MRRYLILAVCVVTLLTGFVLIQFHNAAKAQDGNGGASAGDVDQVTKTVVWGYTVKDIAIAAVPDKTEFRLGQAIPVTIRIKNFGPNAVTLARDAGANSFFADYRVALFDADGHLIPKSKVYIALEAGINPLQTHRETTDARASLELAPGEEGTTSFNVNEWFIIDKEGTYSLVVMRRLWGWQTGFVISNLTPIKIVKGGGDATKPKE